MATDPVLTTSPSTPAPPGPAGSTVPVAPPVRLTSWLAPLRDALTLLRPNQWLKNVYSMAVVALTTSTWTPGVPARLGLATLVFTVASCVVYVGNDIADRRLDRLHPVKRLRPVAAGRIGVSAAVGILAVLLAALVVLVATVIPTLWLPVSAYLAINVAYSGGLRRVPLVDAFVVAIGFQVRLVGGYLAADDRPSQWLMTAVLAVCLVLVLGKRRHELVLDGPEARPALRRYTVHLIDQMIIICIVVAIVSSLLFLWLDAPVGGFAAQAASICAPFALFGLFRYLQVLVVERGGADPVRVLLRDRALLACLAAFASIYLVALLVAHHHPQSSMGAHLR